MLRNIWAVIGSDARTQRDGMICDSPAVPKHDPSRRTALASEIFSFPVMCMSLLALVIFSYAPRGIGIAESDIWWHLLNARELLQHHSLSPVDIYTFTVPGKSWISFEWLSELPFFLAFQAAGLQGILALYSGAVILIVAGIYYRACRAGADCKDGAVATLGGTCIVCVSLAPRTLLFGWLCLTALLLTLDHFRRTGKGLWFVPLVFAIWINLHGSWVYGIAVLVLTGASGLSQGQWGRVIARRWSPTELKKLAFALAFSLAGLFINPFGYKLVWYPFDFVLRQQAILRGSQYWLPVDFGTWNGSLALGLIFALLATAWSSRRYWRLDEVMLALLALWSGLSHLRFMDLAAIIIVPILAPHLRLFPPYNRDLDKPWLNSGIIAAVIASIIIFFPSERMLQSQIDAQYPTDALTFMQSHQLAGRVFNSVEFGGYMEWKAPALKPFIDGRGDIFIHNGILDGYTQTVDVRDPLEIFDQYHIQYILLERRWPLAYFLEHSHNWRLIYSDQVAAVFENSPTAPSLTPQ